MNIPLKEIGECLISVDGEDYFFRPSFVNMSRIGEPEEIVQVFYDLHNDEVTSLVSIVSEVDFSNLTLGCLSGRPASKSSAGTRKSQITYNFPARTKVRHNSVGTIMLFHAPLLFAIPALTRLSKKSSSIFIGWSGSIAANTASFLISNEGTRSRATSKRRRTLKSISFRPNALRNSAATSGLSSHSIRSMISINLAPALPANLSSSFNRSVILIRSASGRSEK
nr:DUF6246 family protein [Franconibacter daqui]